MRPLSQTELYYDYMLISIVKYRWFHPKGVWSLQAMLFTTNNDLGCWNQTSDYKNGHILYFSVYPCRRYRKDWLSLVQANSRVNCVDDRSFLNLEFSDISTSLWKCSFWKCHVCEIRIGWWSGQNQHSVKSWLMQLCLDWKKNRPEPKDKFDRS